MKDHFDSVLSYGIGAASVLHGWLATNSTSVMLYGGLLVLALRLYTDGTKAIATWRKRRG